MSKEIDLRSPEYLVAQRFFKPPFIAFIIVLTCIIFIIAGLQAADYYKNSLQTAIILAEETVLKLQSTAEPLLTMKKEIETVKTKQELLDKIESNYRPLASHLQIIIDTSAASRAELQSISITESGNLFIEGYVSQAKDAATFNKQLMTIPFIDSCQVCKIDLSGNEKYLFVITGILNQGDSNYED